MTNAWLGLAEFVIYRLSLGIIILRKEYISSPIEIPILIKSILDVPQSAYYHHGFCLTGFIN